MATVALAVDPGVDSSTRARVTYAFRSFCAVWGHEVAEGPSEDHPVLCYGETPAHRLALPVPAAYVPRQPGIPAPRPTFVSLGKSTTGASGADRLPCFHPAGGDQGPDLLGEIFEWISGADDRARTERDEAGRIPFSATLHGRYGLAPEIPWASLAMAALNERIAALVNRGWPTRPVPPWNGSGDVAVAATHDLDFLPVKQSSAPWRYVSNLGVSALLYRDARLVAQILSVGVRGLVRRQSPLQCLPRVLAAERARGMSSTCFVICRREHPRDANYDLAEEATQAVLRDAVAAGAELGVHGSYTSLDGPGRLVAEHRRLEESGHSVAGNRQHWLKCDSPLLFEELTAAGARYDSSVAYPGRPGFRRGASFPYAPYDFAREAPYPLVELPLVVMDGMLYEMTRDAEVWRTVAVGVLDQARAHGWGGVSVLWHDPVFGGTQLPAAIGDLYWDLPAPDERWMSAGQLADLVWPRYAQAGLVPAR